MRVRWTASALNAVNATLDDWDSRNKSNIYSKKIITEIELAEAELAANPFFLTDFF